MHLSTRSRERFDVKTGSLRELSSALVDLGTFLPLVLGLIIVASVDPLGLLRFGLLAIVTGVVYRRPIAVQPMKAAAANGYSRFSQLRCIDSDDNIARSDFDYSKMAGYFRAMRSRLF